MRQHRPSKLAVCPVGSPATVSGLDTMGGEFCSRIPVPYDVGPMHVTKADVAVAYADSLSALHFVTRTWW